MYTERKEYPRPQFRRESWQSLNGEWEFDFGGKDVKNLMLSRKINVPFSYQWEASGINYKSVHDRVWYRRTFEIAKENADRRALLCFNAADYETDVWVNGYHVIKHTGGFTPFSADITDYLKDGENEIAVRCVDTLEAAVPRGKQSWTGEPFGCYYYPNSGIWQSVWIEFFDGDCIGNYSLQSDIDGRRIYGYVETAYGLADELAITLKFKDKVIKKQRFSLDGRHTKYSVSLADHAFDFGELLWWIDNPNLINVDFELLKGGAICDRAHARIGLRKISIDGYGKICLNGRPLYQRLILDQGYWQESGLTPPSAEALKKDIELSKAMGFNGARKHQKLEDPYFYYYAEELGFLVWAEMPSAYTFCEREVKAIAQEWQEIVNVAKNFTSVIAYVPLNESWGVREIGTNEEQKAFAKSLYYLTKSLDKDRLISTNDGFETVNPTDILGVHDYDSENAEHFKKYAARQYEGMHPQGWALFAEGERYAGEPVLLTEFGGRALQKDKKGDNWGYSGAAEDEEEFLQKLREMMKGVYSCDFQGFCYTQLTDVQQEVNGLLYPDRKPKAPVEELKEIFGGR